MKKLILKILSIVLAFFLGVVLMGHYMMAGNNELMDSMAEASLPLVSVMLEGQRYNTMHGYTGDMEGKYIRGDVVPLSEDRKLSIAADLYGASVESLFYEVRSLDHSRLIEDTEVEFQLTEDRLEAELPIKDLLDEGEEYALIIQLQMADETLVSYYTRIAYIGENHLSDCMEFARVWHEATFDKENTVSMTKYLEPDSSADNDTLDHVTIHSRYRQVIWDQMAVEPYLEPEVFITEIDTSVTCLRLDYVVRYANEEQATEYYQVQEYFRIRYTEQRMYLLDYDRRANRIFDENSGIFQEEQLELGILNDPIHFKKNEEENIVAFVQNGELWSYDAARNDLSYVFGFRDGWDTRAGFLDHDIRIMDIDESGSMHFLVYGYMNRGIHEGETGIAVYRYDAVANTVEERAFLESKKPFAILREELGELAFVTADEALYLYLDGDIYFIDLESREWKKVVEGLPEEYCLLSDDQSILAWQEGASRSLADRIHLLDLKTGNTQEILARKGEYIRALGFMGTDFIWGAAAHSDIRQDLIGNIIFPMHRITIQGVSGETIREFEYGEQGKYVTAVSVEDNRISLECVMRTENGGYAETMPEPITNNAEEQEEKIWLRTRSGGSKKREYVLSFANKRENQEPKKLTPKQVVFEGSRAVALETEGTMERYYVYGQGRVTGSYGSAREAVTAADAAMGVVTDQNQKIIWRRGSRKTRIQLTSIEPQAMQEGENSLSVSLSAIFNFERVYPNIAEALEQGKNAYEILSENLDTRVLNLSGCELSTVLYYVSEGKPVLAVTGGDSAVVIVGYDVQNIALMEPGSEEILRMGMNDAKDYFQERGNLFVACLEE